MLCLKQANHKTIFVRRSNVYKLKGYLESLCSLEELGELILSHIHLTSIHKLQDGCQVLRKRRYRIVEAPSINQTQGIYLLKDVERPKRKNVGHKPGKGHPSE